MPNGQTFITHDGQQFIRKEVVFPGVSSSGEPLVQALLPGLGAGFEKLAFRASYHPEVDTFIRGVKPSKDKLYVLVNALGAGEYYGPNLNGDFFPEAELLRAGKYGHKTYYHAGVYRNHKNSRRGGISFGKVALVVYNDRMHRVELILELDRAKAKELGHEDLIDKLDAGGYPPVSMGVLVPYDICSTCGRKAKVNADRCACLPRDLNVIDPKSGQQTCMINVFLRFHDISFVVVPADYQGYTIEKVASKLGAAMSAKGDQRQGVRVSPGSQKLAELMKRIPALAQKLNVDRSPTLQARELEALGKRPLGRTLGTSAKLGLVLKPIEFQTLALHSLGQGAKAQDLLRQGRVFGPTARYMSVPKMVADPDHSMISRILSRLLPTRSILEPEISYRSFAPKRGYGTIRIVRVSGDPQLEKIAAAYQGYRLALIENAPKLVTSKVTDEDLELAMLGFSKEASGHGVGIYTLAALYGAYMGPEDTPSQISPYNRERDRVLSETCHKLYEEGSLVTP